MAGQANVEDAEALVRLRAQIVKFLETLSTAVSDAAADVNRTMQWLELDRTMHWKVELRKREEKYQQALEALRHKQLFKGPSGERQSDVDEQKRVKACRSAVEEAQWKQKAVSAHKNRLTREATLFKGALSRVAGIANQTGPMALVELKTLILALEKYGSIQAEVTSSAAEAGASSHMRPAEQNVGSPGGSEPQAATGGIDWQAVQARARDARKLFAGEVLVEEQALDGGRSVIWRDFLKRKIFVGHAVASAAVACLPMSSEELLARIVGLSEIYDAPGDRCVVIEEGRVVWSG